MNALALSPFWAAVVALATALAVAALYRLKPPPRRLLVPSSLIWDRVLREGHHSTDRLRWWLSLLLAGLIAVSIVFAVTGPQPAGTGEAARRLMLVLDDSPTMAARGTDGATRWDHALIRARSVLQACGPDTQVMLADTMRRIATPGFESCDAALARLAGLRLAHGEVPRVPDLRQPDGVGMVVISDGVRITGVPKSAKLESVYEPTENAGITAFEIRPLPADPQRYQAFVEVANAGGADRSIEIALAGADGKRVTRRISVPAGGARAELVDVSGLGGGAVRASLIMPGDGLATDDVAYALLPARRTVRVALVTNGNPYLEKSLRAQPRVRLAVTTPRGFSERGDIDAWVFDRFAPKTRPAAPALLFRPTRADWLPSPHDEMVNPAVAAWDGAHPLLENLSLRDLHVERAFIALPAARAGDAESVLVSARDNVPLVVAHEGAARWISFAFGLEDSNFALHAGFPVFLDNALDWMVGEQAAFAAGLGAVQVPVAGARVIAMDGTELPARAVPGGSLVEIAEPGIFTAVSANRRMRVTANLFDRSVTDLNRSQLPAMKPEALGPAPSALAFDLKTALMLIAALLLGFEWWSWNRRVTL